MGLFERKYQPLLPRTAYMRRVAGYTAVSIGIIFVSLAIGILGYHYFERLAWIDALLNASMILGGMGPVNPLTTKAGKIFASIYALFSGGIFLIAIGVLIAPVIHRIMHHFHLEMTAKDADDASETT